MIDMALEGLLIVLLLVAAGMCWRLDRRLTALRNGQDGMASAVHDLHQATARAEAGLASLRASRVEVAQTLETQIEEARKLSAALNRQIRTATPARLEEPRPHARPARFRTDLQASEHRPYDEEMIG
jgi:hypothetical protein